MSPHQIRWTLIVPLVLVSLTWAGVADAGNGKTKNGGSQTVPFAVLDSGQFSGVYGPGGSYDTGLRELVITNEVDWLELWTQHTNHAWHPGGPAPYVDFSKDIVVGVWAGPWVGPNHSVFVDRIVKSHLLAGDVADPNDYFGYFVEYVEQVREGGKCFSDDILTSPYELIAVARPTLEPVEDEIFFKKALRTVGCNGKGKSK